MAERILTFGQAVSEAIRLEMERERLVFMMGQGVREAPDHSELVKSFGDRLIGMPICEDTIVGAAVGASLAGMRPIVDLHNNGFMLRAMDQIVNEAAKIQYVTGGQKLPLVIRTTIRTGFSRGGATHTQNLTSLCMHIPGLQIAIPSNPYDAKGLLISAIRGNNPVLFYEFEGLAKKTGPVPEGEYSIPLGRAIIRRPGTDVTLISDMCMMDACLGSAARLEKEDSIDAEVIDLRTLVPLDRETIFDSVRKTGRLVIVEQGCRTGGLGAEIAAVVGEECFESLDAPITRVGAKDAPLPYSKVLERDVLPNERSVIDAVKKLAKSGKKSSN